MDNNTIELTRTKTGSDKVVLVVGNGFTTAQVLAMLNSGEALLRSSEVIQRGSPMSEGYTVLAKVTKNESKMDEGEWEDASDTGCAGGCCAVLSHEQRNRNFAESICHKANELAAADNLSGARALLVAAGTLLDVNGGRENESGLWLLASEADVLSREDKHPEAEALLERALKLAQSVYGDAHPGTGVCYMNVGEAAGEQGRYDEALALVQQGLEILEAAEPSGNFTAEYIDGICTAARQLKAKFSHTDKIS